VGRLAPAAESAGCEVKASFAPGLDATVTLVIVLVVDHECQTAVTA
jgi:hypothetical protein